MDFIATAHAATESHVATTSAGEGGGVIGNIFGLFGINLTSFLFQIITFTFVILVVWFLVLKPVVKKMTERQDIIDKSLANAKHVEERMKKGEQEYQDIVTKANAEANQILKKVVEESEKQRSKMMAEAKAEVEEMSVKAQAAIEKQRQTSLDEIRRETLLVVFASLEKVLTKKVTEDLDKKFITEVVQELEKYA